jgi:DNA-nicking Smr family endonuclease
MQKNISMRSPPDDEDFRKALAGVAPLETPRRKHLRADPPAPHARQRERDEAAALAESLRGPRDVDDAMESGEELVYLRDGMSPQVLRKLRRGYWVVEDALDLHGMNRVQAAAGVAQFLRHCLQRRIRCVRIVHGKGLGSRNREPVLKGKLRKWLSQREEVLAYCQAPAREGGGGAVLVLLKA